MIVVVFPLALFVVLAVVFALARLSNVASQKATRRVDELRRRSDAYEFGALKMTPRRRAAVDAAIKAKRR